MRLCGLLILFVSLGVLTGCSGGKKEVDVKGKVTLDDQPFEVGLVFFEQQNSSEKFQATLTTAGTFETKLPAGKYTCYLQNFMFKMQAEKGGNVPGVTGAGALSGKFVPVPQKYTSGATSGFTVEIPPGTVELKMTSSK